MILSNLDKRTTAAALKRNGHVRLASSAGSTHRFERQGWRNAQYRLRSSVPAFAAASSFCSKLGGRPSMGIPAPQGLAIGAFRMHTAPLTLDSSANLEGDA